MEIVKTDLAPKPQGAYSQAVKSGGFVFLAGQIPIDKNTGIINVEGVHKETRIIFDNMEAVLKASGSSMDKIVKFTIYLKELDNIKFVNEVITEKFGENPPARSTVEVSRLPKDINIEIDAIAEV